MADPRAPRTVQILLNGVHQIDPVRTGNPYLWTVFFKADGSTLAVTDAATVSGNCVIMPSTGSHGDLGRQTPVLTSQQTDWYPVGDNGNYVNTVNILTWPIPADIGLWTTSIIPIPVAPSIQPLLGEPDQPGVFGVVVVLLNEGGHLPDHAAEAGRRALDASIERAINGLLRKLGFDHRSITQEDIDEVTGGIAQQVHNAIVDDLSFWEKLWALTEADIVIGQQIWRWDQDVFATASGQLDFSSDPRPLDAPPWPGWPLWGSWTISGSLLWSPPCPADAIAAVLDALLGSESTGRPTPQWYEALRRFRDNGALTSWPGLARWWDTAAIHAPYLAMLTAADDDFRPRLTQFLDVLPQAFEDLEAPISEELIQSAEHVLRTLSQSPHGDLRARSIRGLALLKRMSQVTVSHGLEMASAAGAEDIGLVVDAPTRDDD